MCIRDRLPEQIPKLLPDESSGSVKELESPQNKEDSNSEETEGTGKYNEEEKKEKV